MEQGQISEPAPNVASPGGAVGDASGVRPPDPGVRFHTFSSLRYRDFRFLLATSIIGSGGGGIKEVVVGWLTFELTRSPLLTSLSLTLGGLPLLLAGPFAGVLVDRWDRRKLFASVFVYRAVVTLGFGTIVAIGRVQPWHIFAFVLLVGLAQILQEPIRSSIIPNIVPREGLVNAFALRSLSGNLMGVGMPAVAGFLIALIGAGQTLLLAVPLLLAATLAALAIRVTGGVRSQKQRGSSVSDLAEVARYVKQEPVVLGLLLFAVLPMVLAFPFVSALMPVYASEVFDVGPAGLGILLSSLGAGAALGAFALASLGEVRHKGRLILCGLALTVGAMVVFPRMPALWAAAPILALFTVGLVFFISVSGAAIQAIVPDSLRGRVSALNTTTYGVYPLGALASGGLAELLGAPVATLIAAVVLAVLSVALAMRFRQVWRFT